MTTLFVRIKPKMPAETFFRGGVRHTRDWARLELDEATARAMEEEQMLETSDSEPAAAEAPAVPAEAGLAPDAAETPGDPQAAADAAADAAQGAKAKK